MNEMESILAGLAATAAVTSAASFALSLWLYKTGKDYAAGLLVTAAFLMGIICALFLIILGGAA